MDAILIESQNINFFLLYVQDTKISADGQTDISEHSIIERSICENAILTCVFKDSDFGFMPRSKYQKIRFFKIETIHVPIKTIGTSDSVYPVSFECKGLRNYR